MKATIYYTDHSQHTVNDLKEFILDEVENVGIFITNTHPSMIEKMTLKNIEGGIKEVEFGMERSSHGYTVDIEHVAGVVINHDPVEIGEQQSKEMKETVVYTFSERFHKDFSVTPKNKDRRTVMNAVGREYDAG
jgi:hypothetical protein